MPRRYRPVVTLALLSLLPVTALADGGMWPLNRLPQELLQRRLGVQLDEAWVRHAQLSSVNVGGASGSFVSPHGLVLTNHHVARSCIARLSTPQDDIDRHGFTARQQGDERRCPGLSVRLLQGIEDVTARIPTAPTARKAAVAAMEASCSGPGKRCEVVPLYGGALQHLYRYAEHDDVRLAFAPEAQAANFGGDADNFNYPRYSFDLTLLRVYGADGQPIASPAWLRPATQALKEGDPVFAVGHPGRTERLLPMAMLEALRDVQLPADLAAFAHEADALIAYGHTSSEAARQMDAPLDGVQNRLKALRGQLPALHDAAAMARKQDEEGRVRAASPAEPWLASQEAASLLRSHYPAWRAMQPMRGSLIAQALSIVTLRDEANRPTADRLQDFTGGRGAREAATVRAQVPHPIGLETVRLRAYIERAQKLLGADHAFVRALFGGHPDAAAAAQHWLATTQLHDAPTRARWLNLDTTDFERVADPLLQLARQLHTLRRPVLAAIDAGVDQRMRALAGPMAQARWKVIGDSEAPDATGTLRLSFGQVRAPAPEPYAASWKTTLGGVYARAADFDHQVPFDLAPRLVRHRERLPMQMPLNFTSDVDIIGGNSGSPVLNARGELVGLAFDGNLQSLPGRFFFDGRVNRMTSVTLEAIFLATEQLHPEAAHLAREMRGRR